MESLREVETLICGLDFEVAVGLDLDGTVLSWRTGDDYSVGLSPEEWTLVKDKILTHNHPPGGGSLQTEDLFRANDHFLREIRAVTSDWIFIMQRPATGWVADDRIMDLTEATEDGIHNGVNWEARPEWSRLFWHEMWLRIAPQLGYQYSWVPMWDEGGGRHLLCSQRHSVLRVCRRQVGPRPYRRVRRPVACL
jgi:hypothetical protein